MTHHPDSQTARARQEAQNDGSVMGIAIDEHENIWILRANIPGDPELFCLPATTPLGSTFSVSPNPNRAFAVLQAVRLSQPVAEPAATFLHKEE